MIQFVVLFMMTIRLDRLIDRFNSIVAKVRVARFRANGITLNFVPQGGYRFEIAGDLKKFSIDKTSHIKSDTFIECSGGVRIGRYFHPGRGLTIFSANHHYDKATRIPYDSTVLHRPVVIEDFVWCGANVTIVPGVTVGEGVVIGAGSVVIKDVPRCAVIGGNPARVLKHRDIEHFDDLKRRGLFE